MPEMTGAQFLEKAKAIFPDAIRFLLTGYSDMDAIIDTPSTKEKFIGILPNHVIMMTCSFRYDSPLNSLN